MATPPEGAGAAEAPLPSDGSPSAPPTDAVAPPPLPQFKTSSFLLAFLFSLGIVMLFSTSFRNSVALGVGALLDPTIGFGHSQILLTMFLAGLLEMLLTAVAYNWATDWVKTARIQSWSAAFRKVQMEAMKSGKKDRIEALRPHQQEVLKLTGEMNISQLKGMAVTWFLIIAIYTWIGLFIASASVSQQSVDLGGSGLVNLADHFFLGPIAIPYWIVLFSLYTFPLSYVLRRVLKHFTLRRYELAHLGPPPGPTA